MDWKKEKCINCHFRVGSECRRGPPIIETHVTYFELCQFMTAYPQVRFEEAKENGDTLLTYMEACSEYRREIVNQEEDDNEFTCSPIR